MATQAFEVTSAPHPHFSEDGQCPCCKSVHYTMMGLHEECVDCGFSVDFDEESTVEH